VDCVSSHISQITLPGFDPTIPSPSGSGIALPTAEFPRKKTIRRRRFT
jgi:hypothetical protein